MLTAPLSPKLVTELAVCMLRGARGPRPVGAVTSATTACQAPPGEVGSRLRNKEQEGRLSGRLCPPDSVGGVSE